jgi:hypothetical protein
VNREKGGANGHKIKLISLNDACLRGGTNQIGEWIW